MKSFTASMTTSVAMLLLLLLGILSSSTTTAFTVVPRTTKAARSLSTTTTLYFFGPKDDGSPGDYVCQDCGYVFTKGPAAWAALPDNYSCPPCGSIKRRFKKVPKGSASGKVTVKKGK